MQQHMNTHNMHNLKSNSNSQLLLSDLSAHCVPETESHRKDPTDFIQMGPEMCELTGIWSQSGQHVRYQWQTHTLSLQINYHWKQLWRGGITNKMSLKWAVIFTVTALFHQPFFKGLHNNVSLIQQQVGGGSAEGACCVYNLVGFHIYDSCHVFRSPVIMHVTKLFTCLVIMVNYLWGFMG